MQLTYRTTKTIQHWRINLRSKHVNGLNELCTTAKDKSNCTIKTDQHNLQEQNYCIITERRQVHQNCVAVSINDAIPESNN